MHERSLCGATSNTELYSLDSPLTGGALLNPISEDKVLISNGEEWTEGITYYSIDQMVKDIVLDNKSVSSFIRPKHKKLLSPLYMAIFNMLSGCGLVGLPIQYFKAHGIIPGIVITITVFLLSIYTMHLLVATGIKLNCQDYERLVSKCFGYFGYYLISFSILLFDSGACICYTIILGNCAQDVMEHMFHSGLGTERNRNIFVAAVYFIVILPLCIGKNFRFIEKIQIIGIVIYMFFVGFVVYRYYDEYQFITDKSWDLYYDDSPKSFKDWMDVLGSFGAITFGLIQHDLSFLVYKTVKTQSYYMFELLCFMAMGIQCILCVLLCTFGYLSFANGIEDDILRNYLKRYAIVNGIRIFYIIRMACIFPTAFYVVRHVLFAILYRGYDSYEDTTIIKKTLFTIIPLLIFLCIGLFEQSLSDIMTLFGLLSAVNIAFVVPCLCHLKEGKTYPILFWKAPSGKLGDAIKDVIPPLLLTIFGISATLFGSVEFIYFHITNKWLY